MPLADYQALVDDLVRDDTGKIATADRDEAINRAVARYSKDRPREKVEDVVAAGGNFLALPAGWQTDFSEIRSIEYPIGNVPATIIHQDDYTFYRDPTTLKVVLIDSLPASASVRFTYTIRHQVDGANDTIRADDREPVCAYAAGLLLEQLSSYFSGASDSTIQADSVDRRSKGGEFASRARALRSRYFDELGLDPKRNVAAGVVVDLDATDSFGQDRLLHPRRFR
jgi:hypothetical protein